MKYLSVDVGGTFTKFAVMDEECHFYEKDKVLTRKDNLENFVDMLVELYERYADVVDGIAICAPGIIDSETGFMYNAGSILCVKNVNIIELLAKRCSVPITIENDAKCAAMAEVWRGALSDCKNSIVMIIGTAVGGAVIVDRKVVKGKNILAGEFSYLFTNESQHEDYPQVLAETGSVPGLIKLVSEKKNIPVEELDGEEIFSWANRGDAEIIKCLKAFCRRLAIQISNYQFIVDPERIAIGGGISVQPIFLELIQEELKNVNTAFPHPMPLPEVVTCQFFNDSNLIGALYIHLKSKEEKVNS